MQAAGHIRPAAGQQVGIELVPVRHLRNGNQEVLPTVPDRAFHHALLVGPANAAKVRPEKIMAHQACEGRRELPHMGPRDLRYRHLRVVVADAAGHEAKEPKRLDMSFQERLGALAGEGHHEHRVALDQAHHEEDHLLHLPADPGHGLPKVHLGLSRRLRQRHEDLLRRLLADLPDRILDRCVTAGEPLATKNLPHPFDRVPLLAGHVVIGLDQLPKPNQPGSDHCLLTGPLPHIPRRNCITQDPLERVPVNAELPARRTLGNPIRQHRSSNVCPLFHVRIHSCLTPFV